VLKKRRAVSDAQLSFFDRYPDWLELPEQNPDADMAWFAFPMIVKEHAPFTRRDVQIFFEQRNIQTRVVWTGNITRQPGFRNIKMRKYPGGLPNADRVMERGFLIASHHGVTDEMLAHMHQSFEDFAARF
jgi:CDP-6-deoxy-D-xylo-4-hexulose-3-dehydrase